MDGQAEGLGVDPPARGARRALGSKGRGLDRDPLPRFPSHHRRPLLPELAIYGFLLAPHDPCLDLTCSPSLSLSSESAGFGLSPLLSSCLRDLSGLLGRHAALLPLPPHGLPSRSAYRAQAPDIRPCPHRAPSRPHETAAVQFPLPATSHLQAVLRRGRKHLPPLRLAPPRAPNQYLPPLCRGFACFANRVGGRRQRRPCLPLREAGSGEVRVYDCVRPRL